MTISSPVAYLLGTLVITTTLLPIWRTTRWWVRVWDFPRFQIAVLGIVIVAVFPIAKWPLAFSDAVLLISVALSVLWQLSWVWRYFPGSPRETPITAMRVASTRGCLANISKALQASATMLRRPSCV